LPPDVSLMFFPSKEARICKSFHATSLSLSGRSQRRLTTYLFSVSSFFPSVPLSLSKCGPPTGTLLTGRYAEGPEGLGDNTSPGLL